MRKLLVTAVIVFVSLTTACSGSESSNDEGKSDLGESSNGDIVGEYSDAIDAICNCLDTNDIADCGSRVLDMQTTANMIISKMREASVGDGEEVAQILAEFTKENERAAACMK